MCAMIANKGRKGLLPRVSALLCACVCALALGLCACTFSDTITQVVYDNDPNNPEGETQSVMYNDVNAKETTASLPKLSNQTKSKKKQDTDQDLPSYGKGDSNALVAKPVSGTSKEKKDLSSKEDNKEESRDQSSGDASNSGKDKGKDSSAGEGSQKNKKKGKNPDEEGDSKQNKGNGKNKENEVKVYKDYGDLPEIPKNIKHVTAVGQAAVIVSMLGGTQKSTPLVGADEELLKNKSAQKILAAKGLSKVKALWKNDGSSKGDLTSVDKIIKADPELCYVMEGDDTLTSAQEKQLLKKNIIVYVLPNMSSASKITTAVSIVGQTLKEGGNKAAGELAEEYISFHKLLVNKLSDKNGGLTGGFNYNTGKKVSTDAKLVSSLYVSDWDYKARYNDKNSYLTTPKGVGVAQLGYSESPISYYMSVGGANNVAATGNFRSLDYKSVVWQFTLSKASCAWSDWSYIDRTKVTYPLKGDGFDWSLLSASDDDGSGAGLGCEQYPAVIVADQKMKSAMEAESKSEHDVYYPYPLTSSSKGGVITNSTVGFYSGSNLVDSCIGRDSNGKSVLNDGKSVSSYNIYVNPCGSFSSWAEGSVESVLEASWVYKMFRDKSYDVEGDVEEFYQKFYGYDLTSDQSELDSILSGKEK